MVKLTYIWHDCFLLETKNVYLIFDFWKDIVSTDDSLPYFFKEIDFEKPLYVLVSHHHKDHYTKRIFEWGRYFKNIRYILSKDVARYARHILTPGSIYTGTRPPVSSVTVLSPGDSFNDCFISVDAFPSTDIGNSYSVCAEGLSIFHAGDLNAWIWREESTEEEVRKSIKTFEDILNLISLKHSAFDIAMFPVDSRIGSGYFSGAALFVRKFNVRHFFPMHFCLGESLEEQLKYRVDAAAVSKYANPERGEYICLQSPYSCFLCSQAE